MGKLIRAGLTAIGILGLLVVGLAVPAGANLDDGALPSLTVTKVVQTGAHPVPVDGVFEVQVNCTKYDFNSTLTFNADGSVNSAPEGWVGSGNTWTYSGAHPEAVDPDAYSPSPLRHGQQCEISEVESSATASLAQLPEYSCTFSNEPFVDQIFNFDKLDAPDPGCVSAPVNGPVVVQFGDPRDQSCPQDLGTGDKNVLCKQSADVTVVNTIAQGLEPVIPGSNNVSPATPLETLAPRFTG